MPKKKEKRIILISFFFSYGTGRAFCEYIRINNKVILYDVIMDTHAPIAEYLGIKTKLSPILLIAANIHMKDFILIYFIL